MVESERYGDPSSSGGTSGSTCQTLHPARARKSTNARASAPSVPPGRDETGSSTPARLRASGPASLVTRGRLTARADRHVQRPGWPVTGGRQVRRDPLPHRDLLPRRRPARPAGGGPPPGPLAGGRPDVDRRAGDGSDPPPVRGRAHRDPGPSLDDRVRGGAARRRGVRHRPPQPLRGAGLAGGPPARGATPGAAPRIRTPDAALGARRAPRRRRGRGRVTARTARDGDDPPLVPPPVEQPP